ncbi:hypothetical protein I7104_000002 [Vibrio parahaemolyticus]|nr:hypothetical protein [Vibrio parahaemolyticus]
MSSLPEGCPFSWWDKRNRSLRISVIANACFGLFRTPEPALFLFPYFYSKCSDCASFLIDSPPSSIR